ncbi:hypothetical protein NMY22_g10584 [Coprinellus aureogranulatus]|nr:hypothetical protein NMY22_g10584 [Coprinellus aureogranulatus]
MPPYRTQPPGPYTFSKEERAALQSVHSEWAKSHDKHSGNALTSALEQLVKLYKDDHGGSIDKGVETRLENAVKKWIRQNCKQPKKVARKGSKARSWRDVAYLLNKQEVTRRTDLLVEKKGGNRFTHHPVAQSLFCRQLTKKKIREYKVTARVWATQGPPEGVKKQAGRHIQNHSFAWCKETLKQHGGVFMMCYAFKDEHNQLCTGVLEHNRALINRSFSTEYAKHLDASGLYDWWREWAESHMGSEETHCLPPAKLTSRGVAPLINMDTNEYGEPVLPNPDIRIPGITPTVYYKGLVRAFLSQHWSLAQGKFEIRGRIPWQAVSQEGFRNFVDEEYLPDDIATKFMGDPCRLRHDDALAMLQHWWKRQEEDEDIVFEFSHYLVREGKDRHTIRPRVKRELAPTIHDQEETERTAASPTKPRFSVSPKKTGRPPSHPASPHKTTQQSAKVKAQAASKGHPTRSPQLRHSPERHSPVPGDSDMEEDEWEGVSGYNEDGFNEDGLSSHGLPRLQTSPSPDRGDDNDDLGNPINAESRVHETGVEILADDGYLSFDDEECPPNGGSAMSLEAAEEEAVEGLLDLAPGSSDEEDEANPNMLSHRLSVERTSPPAAPESLRVHAIVDSGNAGRASGRDHETANPKMSRKVGNNLPGGTKRKLSQGERESVPKRQRKDITMPNLPEPKPADSALKKKANRAPTRPQANTPATRSSRDAQGKVGGKTNSGSKRLRNLEPESLASQSGDSPAKNTRSHAKGPYNPDPGRPKPRPKPVPPRKSKAPTNDPTEEDAHINRLLTRAPRRPISP